MDSLITVFRMEEMQKRLPEIMLQKTDDMVELGEHDGGAEEHLEEEEQDEEGGGGGEDSAGEEEPLKEEEQGGEGAQLEAEIEP